jgi:hypothetical protein
MVTEVQGLRTSLARLKLIGHTMFMGGGVLARNLIPPHVEDRRLHHVDGSARTHEYKNMHFSLSGT